MKEKFPWETPYECGYQGDWTVIGLGTTRETIETGGTTPPLGGEMPWGPDWARSNRKYEYGRGKGGSDPFAGKGSM